MIKIYDKKLADIGFYINLDNREDRRNKIENQLNDLKITGINRLSAFNDYDSGPLNCKKSHYMAYEFFLETNLETLLILEDDCLFLDDLNKYYNQIIDDIYDTDWDLFWLGCRNRIKPNYYKNNCYKVSSVSHAHSYIIRRNFCEEILNLYPIEKYNSIAIDELLCLSVYGEDMVANPYKYDFYNNMNPLHSFKTSRTALCYQKALTTQYKSFSDLWLMDVDYEDYIKNSYPKLHE